MSARSAEWGKLRSAQNQRAYAIWNTRDEEMPEVGPSQMYVEDASPDDPERLAALREEMLLAFGLISERERLVLVAHHIVGRTLDEIGEFLDLTPERIRQIESRACRKIRYAFNKTGWECSV